MPNQYDEANSSFNEPVITSTYVDKMTGKVNTETVPITSNARPDPNLEASWNINVFFGIPARPSAFISDLFIWICVPAVLSTIIRLVALYFDGSLALALTGFVIIFVPVIGWLVSNYIKKHVLFYRLLLFAIGLFLGVL